MRNNPMMDLSEKLKIIKILDAFVHHAMKYFVF